jgi:hypothetical protein
MPVAANADDAPLLQLQFKTATGLAEGADTVGDCGRTYPGDPLKKENRTIVRVWVRDDASVKRRAKAA